VLATDADGVVMETLAEPGQVVRPVRPSETGARRCARGGGESAGTVHPSIDRLLRRVSTMCGDTLAGTPPSDLGRRDPQTRTYEARYVLAVPRLNAPLGSTVTIYLSSINPATGTEVPLGSLRQR